MDSSNYITVLMTPTELTIAINAVKSHISAIEFTRINKAHRYEEWNPAMEQATDTLKSLLAAKGEAK
jgi:hypothetical protein